MSSMKAVRLHEIGGPQNLRVEEIARPVPAPGERLVRVRAAAFNRRDVFITQGLYPGIALPRTLGSDGAGILEESGEEVVIDPMLGWGDDPALWAPDATILGMPHDGTFAEYVAVPMENVYAKPAHLTLEQAAALPVAGLTALLTLEVAGFVLGRRVLVTGASGGVGRFAVQLAKLAGAHVTAVSRRTEGLKELGADELAHEIDLHGPTYHAILDAVGGPVLGAALQRVDPGGTVVSFASTVTEPVSYPSREFFSRAPRARLFGFYLFDIIDHTRSAGTDLRRLADLVAEKKLDPQVHLTLPWTEAGEAIRELLERRVNGKAVLTVD